MMTKPDDQNRWQNLWEELGLPPESAQTAAPAAPAAAREEPRPVSPEPLAAAEVSEQASERGHSPAVAEGDEVAVETPTRAPAEERPEEPGGGRRRRGRRGARRGRGEDQTAEEASAPVQAGPSSEELPEVTESNAPLAEEPAEPPEEPGAGEPSEGEPARGRRRRRSRGRGRKKPGDAEATAESDEGPEPAELADEEPEDEVLLDKPEAGLVEDEEELDDLSNLSVPSWNELIASLYRPDR